MSEDEFTKLFKYIESFRKEVNQSFERVDERFDEVNSRIDGLTKLITDYNQFPLLP